MVSPIPAFPIHVFVLSRNRCPTLNGLPCLATSGCHLFVRKIRLVSIEARIRKHAKLVWSQFKKKCDCFFTQWWCFLKLLSCQKVIQQNEKRLIDFISIVKVRKKNGSQQTDLISHWRQFTFKNQWLPTHLRIGLNDWKGLTERRQRG
jgi:hypothetical protein